MKRFIALILSLIMVLSLCPLTIWAEEDGYVFSYTYIPQEDVDATNEELHAAYIQRAFDESLGIETPSAYRTLPLKENSPEWELYNGLKAELAKIAAGTRTSTEISINVTTVWTPADLGVDTFFASDNRLSSDTTSAIEAKLKLVYTSLLANCPLELYWHDKTAGFLVNLDDGLKIPSDNLLTRDALTFDSATYSFYVAKDYSASGTTGTLTTDNAKTTAAANAVANAQKIVDANASKNNHDKLAAYRQAICDLVSYDYSAAAAAPSIYGINPWQMVYVFDENPATNVVCEGYSKAFQYLCDLSTFSGSVECHTVYGKMDDYNHMWNVVTMEDGRNYLVDVTNCDSGTIGADSELFLVHPTSSSTDKQTHTFTISGSNVVYAYDDSMKDLFCEGYLPLSPAAYGTQLQTPTATLSGPDTVYAGEEITLTLNVSGNGILGVETMLEYDEDILEYLGEPTSNLSGWTLVSSGNKFLFTSEDTPLNTAADVLTVTFRVKDTAAHGAALNVSFKDILLSDGSRDLPVAAAAWQGMAVTAGAVVKGDVNLDGQVTSVDALILLRHTSRLDVLTNPVALLNGEVSGNDELTSEDALRILRYAARLTDSL